MDLPHLVHNLVRRGLDARTFREQALALIGREIPHDAYVFALTDPVTMVVTSPLAEVPMVPFSRLPELIRCRYLTPGNRVDELRHGVARSLRTVPSDPEESLLWRTVQGPAGVTDTASVGFADRHGVWGYLELWRTGGHFTTAEIDFLTSGQSTITAGLREAVARTFAEPAGFGALGPAVLVLGPDLQVRSLTDDAAAALARLLPPDEPTPPVPAAAYNIAAALIARESGVGFGEPWARLYLGSGRWVTVRASRMSKDIAVSIEPSTPAERADVFARSHGFSARESDVLTQLCAGLDTRSIAGVLHLSEHTVGDHVKAMLGKADVRSRQVLLSRALGG